MISGSALPAGWTGKLWAKKQGAELASIGAPPTILFTDADIVYAPARCRSGGGKGDGLVLTSLMAKFRCESFAERVFVPAFVFFFQMLYPFAWANIRAARRRPPPAAACWCGSRPSTPRAVRHIRTALIDDCSLAKLLKAQGPIRSG